MKPRDKRTFRPLTLALLSIITVLLVKIILTVGNFALPQKPTAVSLLTPEVMAEDKKGKANKSSTSSKSDDPGQSASASAPPKSVSTSSVSEMVSYLERRDAELKQKEEQLKQKEEYLNQMEQQVEAKLKELLAIQKDIHAFRVQKEESQVAKVRALSKIYGTMKPKEAAKLLENLDDALVVEVISTMNASEAASILSNMDVKKAAKISQALSTR